MSLWQHRTIVAISRRNRSHSVQGQDQQILYSSCARGWW